MAKNLSSKRVIEILQLNQFLFVSQRGSHAKYFSPTANITVIVPVGKKVIPAGTLSSIIRQSRLAANVFQMR